MKIKIICDCGKEMILIEDGRDKGTQVIYNYKYPKNAMEFACSCGKAVDLLYKKIKMERF